MIVVNVIIFALGSAIGSFLNVVIYRIPANISLHWPPSRCPHCLHRLGITENVPVFGWLWLMGRCRWCKAPISFRYPLIEAVTGLLFLLVFWEFGLTINTVGYWILLSWLLVLALIDIDTMTLPNVLTQSGLLLGLGFQIVKGEPWPEQLMSGMVGAVLGIWLFDAIVIISSMAYGQAAMGGGDPKLAAMIGAWLGGKYLLLTAFLACALGAFIGGGAIAIGWISRRQPIPFGPFLSLAALLTIFYGELIISTYLKLFFPSFS